MLRASFSGRTLELADRMQSIVVACRIKDEFTAGSKKLPYSMCASIARQDAAMARKWKSGMRKQMHTAIIAAFRIIFSNESEEWFQRPFLSDPHLTTNYWAKVLYMRAADWERKAELAKRAARSPPPLANLKDRIRAQIDKRTRAASKRLTPTGSAGITSFFKPIPVFSGSDPDSSEEDESSVIDVRSPPRHATDEDEPRPAPSPEKLAQGPESYTRAEMRGFAKVAEAIRNVDLDKGHSLATAQFMDANFSDNSEKCVRARRSSQRWKRNEFNSAAILAGRILEQR